MHAARELELDPDRVAELETDRLLALRIRAVLERRRRRESELSALFEIAGDLAALTDRNQILRTIVQRARHLLSSDVAYLSLNEPDQTCTYMAVTDGIVSAAFRELRIPIGAGLGGLVARTAVPYFTSGYIADERFDHTGEIDSSVTEEGLVAILGVPLLLGTSVIGVLYAANRNAREFSQAEVSLLASLAAHAAIAIDSARLLEETRTAVEELHEANDQIRAHVASVERAADAHDRFAEVMLRGGSVEDVAVALVDVIGGNAFVLDTTGARLAAGGSEQGWPAGLTGDLAAAGCPEGRAFRLGDVLVCPVNASTERLGMLVVTGRPDMDPTDERIVERAAQVVALLLVFRRSLADAENRAHAELVGDLVGGAGRDPAALRERARLIKVDLDRHFTVLVAHAPDSNRARLNEAAARLASDWGGMFGAHDSGTVLLLPDRDPSATAGEVARRLGESCAAAVTVGAAGPSEIALIPDAHAEATRCVRLLLALERQGEGAALVDLGFLALVVEQGSDVGAFVTQTIGPMLSYDARHGTDLVATTRTYFEHQASAAAVGRAMSLHVNTVNQRLARVSALLGPDWRQPDRALQIQLALLLHRLGPAAATERRTSGTR